MCSLQCAKVDMLEQHYKNDKVNLYLTSKLTSHPMIRLTQSLTLPHDMGSPHFLVPQKMTWPPQSCPHPPQGWDKASVEMALLVWRTREAQEAQAWMTCRFQHGWMSPTQLSAYLLCREDDVGMTACNNSELNLCFGCIGFAVVTFCMCSFISQITNLYSGSAVVMFSMTAVCQSMPAMGILSGSQYLP